MPARRALMMSTTTARLNRTCAAMTVHSPICSRARPIASSAGLTASNKVTKAISVAMPITTPGTMIAI